MSSDTLPLRCLPTGTDIGACLALLPCTGSCGKLFIQLTIQEKSLHVCKMVPNSPNPTQAILSGLGLTQFQVESPADA